METKIPRIPRQLIGPPARDALNPTVILFVCAIATLSLSTGAYFLGIFFLLPASLLNSVCLYVLYTVNHEAVHQIAHPNRAVNDFLGRVSAALEGITFPMFKIIHIQHHSHTNHRERDPDFVIGRKPRLLLPVWTLVRLLHDNYFMVRQHLWHGKRAQLLEHFATVGLQGSIIFVAYFSGHFGDLMALWVLPVIGAGAIIEITVAWLVHFPHESQHPLESTRMFRGKLWQALTLNQSFHLVHHLWPSIPWFRYGMASGLAREAVQNHSAMKGSNDEVGLLR